MYTEIVLVDLREIFNYLKLISNKLFFALYLNICNLQLKAFTSKLLGLLNINIITLDYFFIFIS